MSPREQIEPVYHNDLFFRLMYIFKDIVIVKESYRIFL